jgi:hypothetical protein
VHEVTASSGSAAMMAEVSLLTIRGNCIASSRLPAQVLTSVSALGRLKTRFAATATVKLTTSGLVRRRHYVLPRSLLS